VEQLAKEHCLVQIKTQVDPHSKLVICELAQASESNFCRFRKKMLEDCMLVLPSLSAFSSVHLFSCLSVCIRKNRVTVEGIFVKFYIRKCS
jgi:hypothetical protein